MSGVVARTTQVVMVNSGTKVSENIDLRGAASIGLSVPTITSGQLYLQVGQASGSYLGRLHDPRSNGAWFWNMAAGSASIILDTPASPFPFAHARVELQNAVTDTFSLSVFTAR